MNNNPKISVIIPTYQPKHYIFDCFESVVANDLEQVEVLVIYNGKKNDLFTKIADFCNENIYFRLIYTEVLGVSNARNIGISQAQGEYVTFIDDDDWVSDNYFNVLLEHTKADTDTVVVSNVVCYNDKTKQKYIDYIGKSFHKKQGKPYSVFAYRKFFSTIWGKLIPKKCLQNIRFDKDLKLSEDSLFMFEVSKNIKNVVLTNEEVIYYRRVGVFEKSVEV